MTPLTALFKQHFSEPESCFQLPPPPVKKAPKENDSNNGMEVDSKDNEMEQQEQEREQEETPAELFVQAVDLLWNLCEASGRALEVANREGLVQALIGEQCLIAIPHLIFWCKHLLVSSF